MQKFLSAAAFCISAGLSFSAHALTSRVESGLGFTNNAYLSSSDKKTDTYLKLGSSTIWDYRDHKPQLRLGYRNYFKTHDNDLLNWFAGDRFAVMRSWSLKAGAFGNHYVRQSPGTTDESFSNLGVEAQAETSSDTGLKRTLLTWGPGAEARRYTAISQRTDATVKIDGTLEYEASPDLNLDGIAQSGFTISNQGDYSRVYLDLAAAVDYNLNKTWSWSSELDFRHTAFLSRTATTQTETAKARGKGPEPGQKTVTKRETYDNVMVTSKLIARFLPQWSAGGQISLENQSSVSGYSTYSAIGFYGFLIGKF